MKEIIVACSMLEDEMRMAMGEVGCELPVIWLERGLHEQPARLGAELQKLMDMIEADTVLLGFALCGNAIAGLGSATATLVAPRFDDCIHLLASGTPGDRGRAIDCRTLYYTAGWQCSEKSLDRQYYELADRCGEAKAAHVYKRMLKGYRSMHLIDTGAYDMEAAREKLEKTAALFGLETGADTGTLRVLKKLLTRQWDEEFYVLPPGGTFQAIDFMERAK